MAAFSTHLCQELRTQMGSFGERLQREREMRGVSIEEIAASTKIGSRLLRAIEQEDFDKLPGGIFNKGFIRAYAKYLGLNEDQTVADYLAALEQAQRPLGQPEPATGDGVRVIPLAATAVTEATSEPTASELRANLPLVLMVAFTLVATVAFFTWQWKYGNAAAAEPPVVSPAAPRQSAPAQQPVVLPAAVAAETSAPTTTSGSPTAQTGQAASAPADEFTVTVRAKEEAWIEIVTDERGVFSGVLRADEERAFSGKQTVVVRLGNAPAVLVRHNGKPLTLAAERKVQVLSFTPEGLRQ